MPTPRGISGPHSHFSRGIRISNRDRLGSTGLDWDLDSAGVGLGSDSRETPHLPDPPDLPDLSDWDLTPRQPLAPDWDLTLLGSTGIDWDLDSTGVGVGSDARESPHTGQGDTEERREGVWDLPDPDLVVLEGSVGSG